MELPTKRVRKELVTRLRKELVGPNTDTEVLYEAPGDRYLCGILWPAGMTIDGAELETENQGASEDSETSLEQSAPMTLAMKPSSIGVSFLLEPGCTKITVKASWGTYTEDKSSKPVRWVRQPKADSQDIDLILDEGRQKLPTEVDPTIWYEYIARVRGDQRIAVSLFMLNRKQRPEKGREDAFCVYQPCLTIMGASEDSAPFAVRELTLPDSVERAPDQVLDDLLYRHQKTFAIGHGTAVQWKLKAGRNDQATEVETVTIPEHEVPRMIPLPWQGEGSLSMQVLSDAPDGDAIADYLTPLVEAYDEWIQTQTTQYLGLEDIDETLRNQARENLRHCNQALNRMRKGLDLIADRSDVLEAFRFANRAMAQQRIQALWAQACKKQQNWSRPQPAVKTEWRPFQIAFILQAMTGLVEPTHEDRGLVDLLWFPTGGGKTEAYLGLAAFSMALRRLRGEQEGMRGDAGVSVIMRYTLRLLTIQQFQRAATLICAMELLRQQVPEKWGIEPFRIGLWVGIDSTPNDFDAAETAVKPGNTEERSTPVQLVACPWCGAPLSKKNYRAVKRRRRILIGCSRKECEFALQTAADEGIPAVMVDEDIYRLAPALVIGTVDKFARVSWKPETQALFGKVKGHAPGWGYVVDGEDTTTKGHRENMIGQVRIQDTRELLPPDLIIQDELHLISGPLGTMVGAYETAIEELCSRTINNQRVGPKVLASTATIRRAEDQVKNLYERRVAIFPPPGLAADDSFFAVEQARDRVPGRLYVGISAPPRSVKTALVRVYAVLMASVEAIKEPPAALDPYYTLVGYYNSLRELGGAVRLVEDDIPARIATLARPNWNPLFDFVDRRLQEDVPELTSRQDSRDIPKRLAELERPYTGMGGSKEPPLDIILASNMISVGMDVSRLGLMVVTGQPKTTSEYIQATSRVGREHPGLVITVYNWARPRDLSHYERFGSYHAALYRYVEAVSVTPFSSRARDRALWGIFIAMCRHQISGLAGREEATKFKASMPTVERLRERILKRAEFIDASLSPQVRAQLEGLVAKWAKEAKTGALQYSGTDKTAIYLMRSLGDNNQRGLFPVPNSMRDVETGLGLYLLTEADN